MKYIPSALEEDLQIYLSLASIQAVGMRQAGCCRAVPVVKSVSVKADVSFLYTSLYLHTQS